LAADSQPFVDLERLIDVGVIYQSFPANSRAGLFEIGTHYDAEIIRELFGKLLQTTSIFESRGRVVERTRATDDQEAIGSAHDNFNGIFAALDYSFEGGIGNWDLRKQQLRGYQRILPKNYSTSVVGQSLSLIDKRQCSEGGSYFEYRQQREVPYLDLAWCWRMSWKTR
jgi:hypothetical protein